MRRITGGKQTIKLTEKDYKVLLERFDLNNVQIVTGNNYSICSKCICPVARSCESCPFFVLAEGTVVGCQALLTQLGLCCTYASLTNTSIHWRSRNNAKARAQIDAVHDYLIELKKVR